MSERGVVATGGETLCELLATLLVAGDESATSSDVAACVAAGRAFVSGRRLQPGDARLVQVEDLQREAGEALPVEPLQAGQRVELSAVAHNTSDAPLVLEERWGLLAVLKPSGLASEPDRRGTDSLVSRLALQLGRDVHAVSRLDAQVSGVMLVATDESARKLSASLNAAAFERHYTGLVADGAAGVAMDAAYAGRVAVAASGVAAAAPVTQSALAGTWSGAIGDGERGKRKVGGRGAKPAVTHYRELCAAWPPTRSGSRSEDSNGSTGGGPSEMAQLPTWLQGRERRELRCRRFGFKLETGRTHQIRVHAAHAGLPLLGDTLYGGPGAAILPSGNVLEFGRIALHASELIVHHAGDTWRVSAPLPELLEIWSARLVGSEA